MINENIHDNAQLVSSIHNYIFTENATGDTHWIVQSVDILLRLEIAGDTHLDRPNSFSSLEQR